MKKQDGHSCGYLVLFIFLAFLLYKLISFVLSPEGIKSFLELFKALGICLGLGVLVFIAFSIFASISSRKPRLRLHLMSKEYPARCDRVKIEKPEAGLDKAEIAKAPVQEANCPIHLFITITNFGLGLMPIPEDYSWDQISPDNVSRFNYLSNDHAGPIILPMGYFYLYYVLYNEQGDPTFTSPWVQSTGYYDTFPPPPNTGRIKIIISYNAIIETENLDHIIPRDLRLNLTLAALDKKGQDDSAVTSELFNSVFQFIQSSLSSSEDDSWMYQSRPMLPPWY